jgi:hypothetical protein
VELIDRYVYEVGRYLPYKNRADILVELRSLLFDTLEARVKGEPGEADVVALLKEFGPPPKVAASYRPEGQYLVGPELFPTFRMVIGIALLVMVVVHAVLFAVSLFTNPDPLKALDVLSGFFGSAMSGLGTIVLVFYVLQYFDVRLAKPSQEWDPSSLPVVDVKNELPRGGTLAGIVLALVFLVVLLAFPNYIGVVVTPGTPALTDPVITSQTPLIVIALLVGLVVDIVLLWRGRWQTGTRLAKIAANLFSLVVIGLLISGHAVWLAQHTGHSFFGLLSNLPAIVTSGEELTLPAAMYFIQLGLIIAMIVTVIETIEAGYRFFHQLMGWDSALSLDTAGKTSPHP